MSQYHTSEKLKKVMSDYVPEFAYDRESREPGCVLTTLLGDMLEESAKNFDQAVPKHEIQFLNLFDEMMEEPVSAAKGYVQFTPVEGYEEEVLVPKRTQVLSDGGEVGDIIFETQHDMMATTAQPEQIIVTDRAEDKIVITRKEEEQLPPFTAFDIQGENQAKHRLILCFKNFFDGVDSVRFSMELVPHREEEKEELLQLLSSDKVAWYLLQPGEDAEEEQVFFDKIWVENGRLQFYREAFQPVVLTREDREGYFLVLDAKQEKPDIYLDTISLSAERERVIPKKLLIDQIPQVSGRLYPFGKPLSIYQEFAVEDRDVLSKKGAEITIHFSLEYVKHEELLEIPEIDMEYKTIMRKPQKTAEIKPAEVKAEYVLWEYYSVNGWKRLFQDENASYLFSGIQEGELTLTFQCPQDMMPYEEENTQGRIRVRLLKADNIYKVPAVYLCPVISDLRLSYSYAEHPCFSDYARLENNDAVRDISKELKTGGNLKLFYSEENGRRCMYFGFSRAIHGLPVSLYLEIENFSDIPVHFEMEYYGEKGFAGMRFEDDTDGLLGSGNILMLIPKDAVMTTLYGYQGGFVRMILKEESVKEYALPRIKKTLMNMAKVENKNTKEEVFYLDSSEESVDLQLPDENILEAKVYLKENTAKQEKWVLWTNHGLGQERTYSMDLAAGRIHITKQALSNVHLSEEGPQVKVTYYNYTGAMANVGQNEITTLRNSIRYISHVQNPFPTYGGYDSYTKNSVASYVSRMLRTRNRAVSAKDFEDMIAQATVGVRQVRCEAGMDLFGNPATDYVTIAVLMEEYEKGMHVFSEIKEEIRKKIMESSNLPISGKELFLTQPHFIRFNVRIWLEPSSTEQAYELTNRAEELIRTFLDPLQGGVMGQGWRIGELPRSSQILAYIRSNLPGANITKMTITAWMDGQEIDINEDFNERNKNPFVLAVNGNHIVYLEVEPQGA